MIHDEELDHLQAARDQLDKLIDAARHYQITDAEALTILRRVSARVTYVQAGMEIAREGE